MKPSVFKESEIRKLKRSTKRILVIYWGYFGDLLISVPFLEALRRGFPKCHITYLIGKSQGVELVRNNPHINEAVVAGLYTAHWLLNQEPYDLVIDLCCTTASRNYSRLSGAPVKLWGEFRDVPSCFYCLFPGKQEPLKIPLRNSFQRTVKIYRVDQFLEINSFLGVPFTGSRQPKIYLTLEQVRFAQKFFKNLGIKRSDIVVGIHPGGKLPQRLWEPENYSLLINRLHDELGIKAVLFCSPMEEPVAKRVLCKVRYPAAKISRTDFSRYIALVSRCNAFVSSDGGPLHIGLALGVPAAGIFRLPSNITYWYDYRKRDGFIPLFIPNRKNKTKASGPREVERVIVALKRLSA